MQPILLTIQLFVSLALIGLVMLQKSEGGALGIGGGGGNLFSSRGVGNALTRATAIFAALFFATSIALTVLAGHQQRPVPAATDAPTAPVGAPAAPASQLPKLPGVPTGQ